MRRKNISLDSLEDYSLFSNGIYSDNNDETPDRNVYKDNKKLLIKVLNCELTEQQKNCIMLYFSSNRTLEEVGLELGISKATVSKHIAKGKSRIKKYLSYASEGFYLRQ